MTAHLITLYRRHPHVAPVLFYTALGACTVTGAGLAVVGFRGLERAAQGLVRWVES